MVSPVVAAWAKTESSAALAWAARNLNGTTLANAVGTVICSKGKQNIPFAVDLVDQSDPSVTKNWAAVALAQLWWPSSTANKPAPPEAVRWLAAQAPQVIYAVTDVLQHHWSKTDPMGIATFLASPDGQHALRAVFNIVAHEFASRDPQAAIRWASTLPDSNRNLAKSTILKQWQLTQPKAAEAWLKKNPQF